MQTDTLRVSDWAALAHEARYHCGSLARRVGMCLRTLQRTFRRLFHATPKCWLQRARMARALHMLATQPGLRIKELAFELGYGARVANFCREFKRRFHCTPKNAARRAVRILSRFAYLRALVPSLQPGNVSA